MLRCLRRFADLRKTRPWNFGACTSCVLSFCVVFLSILNIFLPVLGSPSRVRLCGCLRRFADLRKNTPLEFRGMYLVCFVDSCCFSFDFEYFFAGSRVSQQGACVWLACGASPTSEKDAPRILEHVPCVFCRFLLFLFNLNTILLAFGSPNRVRLCGCPVCRSHSHTNFSVPPLPPSV